jgi:hypothetical protein
MSLPSSSFHTLLIGSSLTNTFLHHSFNLLCIQSVLTFRPTGFSTFSCSFFLSKQLVIVRLVPLCSIGSVFFPGPQFVRTIFSSIQISPLIQPTFHSTIHHPSLTICDDFSCSKIIDQWFQRTVAIRSAFLSICRSFCLQILPFFR